MAMIEFLGFIKYKKICWGVELALNLPSVIDTAAPRPKDCPMPQEGGSFNPFWTTALLRMGLDPARPSDTSAEPYG